MVFPALPPLVTTPPKLAPVLPSPRVTLPSNATAPAALMPELVLTVPSNVVGPVPCRVSAAPVPLPRAAIPPTAAPKDTAPAPALTVRFWLPSTVDAKATGELVLATVTGPPTETGLLKSIAPAAVLVTLPARLMLPEVAV